MTLADAAEVVLRDAGKPLSSREISEIAVAKGLISPKSREPWVYIAAAMRKDNRRRLKEGVKVRFTVMTQGNFSLSR